VVRYVEEFGRCSGMSWGRCGEGGSVWECCKVGREKREDLSGYSVMVECSCDVYLDSFNITMRRKRRP
jgi:hypothetical protein